MIKLYEFEMARAAGEISGAGQISKIGDIIWIQPIRLNGKPPNIRVSLYPGKNAIDYEIWALNDNETRIVYSRGKLYIEKPFEDKKNINLEEIKSRCDTVDGPEFYNLCSSLGLSYGKGFQTVRKLFYNKKEALAIIELDDGLYADSRGFVLNPPLLDGAFQTVLGLTHFANMSDDPVIPFSLGNITFYGPTPRAFFAYATHFAGSGGKFSSFSVQIADSQGRIMTEIENFSTKALREKNFFDQANLELLKKLYSNEASCDEIISNLSF